MCSRSQLEEGIGVSGDGNAAWIGYDQLRPFLLCLHDLAGDHRVLACRVAAYDKDAVRVHNSIDRIGHRTTAERGGKSCHRRGVSETGAVIDVVRTDHSAREFHDQIIFLVGAFGA